MKFVTRSNPEGDTLEPVVFELFVDIENDIEVPEIQNHELDIQENEFLASGYYSNFSIEKIFSLMKNSPLSHDSDITILTAVQSGLAITYFETMTPEQAILKALEQDDIYFDRNGVICPLFSSSSMSTRNTLLPTNNSETGHWCLIYLNLISSEIFIVDGLDPNNGLVSETALFDFASKLIKAFQFYRPDDRNGNKRPSMSYVPIQCE